MFKYNILVINSHSTNEIDILVNVTRLFPMGRINIALISMPQKRIIEYIIQQNAILESIRDSKN